MVDKLSSCFLIVENILILFHRSKKYTDERKQGSRESSAKYGRRAKAHSAIPGMHSDPSSFDSDVMLVVIPENKGFSFTVYTWV